MYSALTGSFSYVTPFRPTGVTDEAFCGFARRQNSSLVATALLMPGGRVRRMAWLDTDSPPRAGVLPDLGD